AYKVKLQAVRDQERMMLRDHTAAMCPERWSVNGDARQGQRMIKQYSKLVLRAFNGESDAAVAEVNWNNISKMEQRLRKAFDDINELGSVMHVSLSTRYLDLKIDELRVAYEYEEKRYQ